MVEEESNAKYMRDDGGGMTSKGPSLRGCRSISKSRNKKHRSYTRSNALRVGDARLGPSRERPGRRGQGFEAKGEGA